MKILFFGFSVTGMSNSFARQISNTLSNSSHRIDICSLGGLHPTHASFLIDSILKKEQYDYVILEIFTSMYRSKYRTRDEYHWPIWFMCESCLKMGATPILLSLFRGDVDYQDDQFGKAAQLTSQRLNIAFFNFAEEMANINNKTDYFLDEVHPSTKGDAWYTGRVSQIIENCLLGMHQTKVKELAFQANDLFAININQDETKAKQYSRSGYTCQFIETQAGDELKIKFAAPTIVNAISYLMGPKTGYVTLSGEQQYTKTILAYDSYCYYERYQMALITPPTTDFINIKTESEIPKIELLKGEKDSSSRIGKFSQLFCSKFELKEIVARASHAWN